MGVGQLLLAVHGVQNVANLVIQQKGKPPRSYALIRHTTIIGRGKDCGLILPDISVSRHHAQVVDTQEGTFIQDLGSQNGTSVNAHPVSNRKLENGDVIQIGKFVLVFRPSPKGADSPHSDPGLGNYELTGRTAFLEKVTALGGMNAHQTSNLDKQDLQAIRETITRKEKGALVSVDNAETHFIIGEKGKQFGTSIPCQGLRGGTVVVVWSGRTHRVVKKGGMFTTLKVNGDVVKEKSLEPGDVIEIGKNRFRYEA
jgi:pSer/pThr/pTyr-binding forkhead associated (FHA) protein